MSRLSDIATAISAQVETTLPAYSHERGEGSPYEGFLSLEQVSPSDYPFALVYNPVVTIDRGDERQSVETTAFSVILLRKKSEHLQLRQDVSDLIDAVSQSNGFADVVLDAWVSTADFDEASDRWSAVGVIVSTTEEVV